MAKDERKKCITCNKEHESSSGFYIASNTKIFKDGRVPVCKDCVKEYLSSSDMEDIYMILRIIDRPFLEDTWNDSIHSDKDTAGEYMRMLGIRQNRNKRWKDSIYFSNVKTSEQDDISTEYNIDALKEKYGYGYPDNEYLLFEKKYSQLESSFQLLTTMHEEYFKEYCINKVKETLAKARGEFKEAKEWAAMVKDVAEAGKLKPSQMSKADLSAGLDGFGQLARIVDEKKELMPLLPKFTQQPKDKVDIVLWLYINYIRDLKGMNEVGYKDIWDFYEKRREAYEKQELDSDPSMNAGEENG